MNTENQTLRLSLAVFAAILVHTLIVLAIHFLNLSLIPIKEKTIPFQLISADKSSQLSGSSRLSTEENARAAQEYLATLNQSQFETQKRSEENRESKTQKTPLPSNLPSSNSKLLQQSQNFSGSNPSTAIHGLQNIFSQNKRKTPTNQEKQISTKNLEVMSDYEISLLNALKKDVLYDPFHEVMKTHKKKEVSYSITLFLFPNGAIKNASILKPSGINRIDELALQTAYRASPFPPPPHEDIQKGFRYNIPIIYQDKQSN